MSFFAKKFFWVIGLLLIFGISVKNTAAVCSYEGTEAGNPKTFEYQTNESMCWTRFEDVKSLFLQTNEGTEVWECQSDGSWNKKKCTDSVTTFGVVTTYVGSKRCLESEKGKAQCIEKPTKSCTFSDGRTREANGTLCGPGDEKNEFEGINKMFLYRCDGYQGKFFVETCANNLTCVEDTKTKQAKCGKAQCTHEGISRSVGEFACFGDDKKRIGECTGSGFYGGFAIHDCGGRCIQMSNTHAECTEKNEEFCSSGNIYRRMGETACIDNKVMLCSINSKFILANEGDCPKKGQRCDTIDANGRGWCVKLTEPLSPFNAGTGGECVCNSAGYVTTNNCDVSSNFIPICSGTKGECQCTQGGNLAKTNAFCPNFGPGTTNPQIYTAFGCVPIKTDKFMEWLLPYIFGIAGGISFLLMVYGFILMTFSGGDPKKIQGAKETVTSAIIGLLICIFSLFILRLIATDILKIPGIK